MKEFEAAASSVAVAVAGLASERELSGAALSRFKADLEASLDDIGVAVVEQMRAALMGVAETMADGLAMTRAEHSGQLAVATSKVSQARDWLPRHPSLRTADLVYPASTICNSLL